MEFPWWVIFSLESPHWHSHFLNYVEYLHLMVLDCHVQNVTTFTVDILHSLGICFQYLIYSLCATWFGCQNQGWLSSFCNNSSCWCNTNFFYLLLRFLKHLTLVYTCGIEVRPDLMQILNTPKKYHLLSRTLASFRTNSYLCIAYA